MNRREFIAASAAALALPATSFGADAPPVFQQRGYYLCFMRMPTFGLARGPVVIDGEPVEWGGMYNHPACGGTGVSQRFV